MKSFIITLTLVAMTQLSFAQFNNPNQTVYEKLADINKEWLKNPGALALQTHTTFATDESLIQFHLQLVEARLRNASTAGLSETQRANRAQCLDYLNTYWQTGVFPKNTHHSVRTPYFIDDYGTYCAVGYLLQQSGYEQFAQRIHDENNYAYIHDMDYPELLAWADEYGFSVDELAWIQPGYATPPPYEWTPVEGSDITDPVTTIAVDETDTKLYVAAGFGNAGNGIMSFDGLNWDDMDGGVDGTVNVILVDGQNVIVGGDFSSAGGLQANSVAVWNGSSWSTLGSGLQGKVNALAYFNDELYAGGDLVWNSVPLSLVKWDGSQWLVVLDAPQGEIFALKEFKKELYAGGDFTSIGSTKNFVKMSEQGFSDIGGYPTVVRALEVSTGFYPSDTAEVLLIGGDIETNDTTYEIYGFAQWNGAQVQHLVNNFSWYTIDSTGFVASITAQGNRLFVTGNDFGYSPMYGYYGANAVVFSSDENDTLAGGLVTAMNGEIQAAVEFRGAIILGGDFDSLGTQPVNKLAATGEIQEPDPSFIRTPETSANVRVVYEQSSTVIYFDEPNTANVSFTLYDATGKQVINLDEVQNSKVELEKSSLAPGVYLFSFNTAGKQVGMGNVLIR